VQYVSNLRIEVVVVVVVEVIIILIDSKPIIWELDNTRNGLRQSQIIIMSPVIIFSLTSALQEYKWTKIQVFWNVNVMLCGK